MYQTEKSQNKQNMPAVDGDVVSSYFLHLDMYILVLTLRQAYEIFSHLTLQTYKRSQANTTD